jgi:hypothetical protein
VKFCGENGKKSKSLSVFWPRLEICLSFVLSELGRILFVVLCRLEMGATRGVLRVTTGSFWLSLNVAPAPFFDRNPSAHVLL